MRTPLAAIVTSLLLGSARADCPPAAVPIGEPTIVQAVADRLSSNGIATTATAGCPVVRVRVEQRGEQLHLRVEDAFKRLGERDVYDVATAAAVIESWTLQEIEAGALPESAPAVRATPLIFATPAAPWRSSVGAAGRSWVGDDGSTWIGATVGGCMKIGWSCIGASIDFGQQTTAIEDISAGTQHSRAIHVMATADVPRRIGGFVLSPGVTLGYGWNRIHQGHLDDHAMPFAISHANHALGTGGHVVLSRSLGQRVAVFAGLFGDVAAQRTEIPDGPRGRLGVSLGARLEAP